MSKNIVTEADLAHAVEAGERRMATEFRAADVRFDETRELVELTMVDGWGLFFQRADIEEFRDVGPSEMKKLEISPAGMSLDLDDFDIHISVHGLVTSFISPHLMAKSLGRRGGESTSPSKKQSARENGKKGGRPRKVA